MRGEVYTERPMRRVQLGDRPYTIAMLAVLTVATAAKVDVDKDGSRVAVDVDGSVTARGWGVWCMQSNRTVSRPVCGVHLMVEGQ
jgi:hypothetical protein